MWVVKGEGVGNISSDGLAGGCGVKPVRAGAEGPAPGGFVGTLGLASGARARVRRCRSRSLDWEEGSSWDSAYQLTR